MAITKGLGESLNWLKPDLLALSEHVFTEGKYANRNAMIRQLVLDKALEQGIIDEGEHKLWSLIANDVNRGGCDDE